LTVTDFLIECKTYQRWISGLIRGHIENNNKQQNIKMSIFEEQVSRKPNHYPWAEEFIEVMHNGFWTDKEFSFSSDVQDFNITMDDQQREIIIRTLSAIGQIEVAVKKFWAKLGDNLPPVSY
jgi:ribonucleotide reductase beta subunit family protein with ferritin-like domain